MNLLSEKYFSDSDRAEKLSPLFGDFRPPGRPRKNQNCVTNPRSLIAVPSRLIKAMFDMPSSGLRPASVMLVFCICSRLIRSICLRCGTSFARSSSPSCYTERPLEMRGRNSAAKALFIRRILKAPDLYFLGSRSVMLGLSKRVSG